MQSFQNFRASAKDPGTIFSPPKPHFQDIEFSHLEPIENNLQTVLYLNEMKSTPINI